MGNVRSRPEAETRIEESSLTSSLPVLFAPPLLAAGKKPQRKYQEQKLERSASLEGFSTRLNGSFRRIYRSLSCSSLHSSWPLKRDTFDQHCRRPLSRVSRRRRKESTAADARLLARTCWPVSNAESLFLPHFPVDCNAVHRFHFVGHVANGAFGKVHRVRRASEDFALKVLSKSEIINCNAIRQLKDEVDIQTICGHHPFIAKCLNYWQSKTKVFLLSNFYANGELFQRFKKFPIDLVRLYIAEIALALDFLHQAGVIYRDLKPENVLFDQDYHVRLIDFGLSKWLSIGSRTRTLCGTLQYMGKSSLYASYTLTCVQQ